jgi:hypothetical protein
MIVYTFKFKLLIIYKILHLFLNINRKKMHSLQGSGISRIFFFEGELGVITQIHYLYLYTLYLFPGINREPGGYCRSITSTRIYNIYI